MRTVTSKFATNLRSKKAFKELILLGLLEDKKNPHYRADYVDRIRKAEKESFVDINLEEYGITL